MRSTLLLFAVLVLPATLRLAPSAPTAYASHATGRRFVSTATAPAMARLPAEDPRWSRKGRVAASRSSFIVMAAEQSRQAPLWRHRSTCPQNSAVCGNAAVSGLTQLINGSVVNGHAIVSGQSSLDRSTVNGNSTVSESVLSGSILNGDAKVSRSEVVSSMLNGQPVVTDAHVTNSVINGRASVIGRTVQGSVLNN